MKADDEAKPLTGFAPPPLSASLTLAAFFAVSVYFLPSSSSEGGAAAEAEAELFRRRIFPNIVSFEMLLFVRLFFAFVCFGGFIAGWILPS